MFIVFEGIDGSGKTVLSKLFSERMGFQKTKEPTFSSQEAESLNLSKMNENDREAMFLIDRFRHQAQIKQMLESGQGVVCDRYLWAALAYSRVFSPSTYPFLKSVYISELWLQPDVYVLVDTPINVCLERKEDYPEELLTKVSASYEETSELITVPIIEVQGVDNPESTLDSLLRALKLNERGNT